MFLSFPMINTYKEEQREETSPHCEGFDFSVYLGLTSFNFLFKVVKNIRHLSLGWSFPNL